MKKPPARAVDVARMAGVSTATVSRALAAPDTVAPETRARVMKAMARVDYTPNVAARTLRARQARMVLVIVPDIASPFFPEILKGIDAALTEAGYGMIIGDLDGQPQKEGRFVDLCAAGAVDGTLLLSTVSVPRNGRRSLLDARRPVVAVSEAIEHAPFPQVVIDNRASSRAIVRQLIGLGHHRIAFLSGPTVYTSREREAGFRDALAEAGLPCAPDLLLEGDYSAAAGAAGARSFLAMRNRPTAVHAAGDLMAIAFMRTVQMAGLLVPDDVSVAGFDGIEFAALCDPPLTTVRQPRRELGRVAAKLLIDRIEGRAASAADVTRLAAPIEPGASIGPPKGSTLRTFRGRRD